MQMKRVVVFLPPEAVKSCDALAARYQSNRSEVVRLALAEGMPGAVEALERLRELRLVEAAGAGAARLWRVRRAQKRPGRGRPRSVLDSDRAVSMLLEYGRAVRAADSELSRDGVRESLRVHAQVIGVSPDDLDDVLIDVLGQMFGEPQVQPVADPSQPPE